MRAGSVTICITRGTRLFRRRRQLNVIVEAFAHLLLTIYADHLREFGDAHLRLHQNAGVIAVVERAYGLPGEFYVRFLINTHRHGICFVKQDIGCHQNRVAHQSVVDVMGMLAHLFFEGG